MYVSARSDYAIRAMLAIAAGTHTHPPPAGAGATATTAGSAAGGGGGPVKAATLATEQEIPLSFLHGILHDLRRAGLLLSYRGVDGGYLLARPADQISVGDVLRALSGSLTTVRGLPTEAAAYHGVATELGNVWLAVHSAIEQVVDRTSLADLLAPHLRASEPGPVR
ncbi:Rrf2 family transcriptional regulator [Micromonospora sp. NBC_01699]|uniref:RrF2 family transcriptional regulator n=1 Tax=Micromonospora sp. NBC_01699 TaxID=2975984 RepID=UPI002E37A482|nr:Rrf2 family transcriptional regulator [Micromonospora sp. NBC_01699]